MANVRTAAPGRHRRCDGRSIREDDASQTITSQHQRNRTPSAPVALTWIPLGSAVERVFAQLAEKAKETPR